MAKIIVIWLLFMALFLYIGYWAYLYRNPFKLIMVFGKKGSGKSTLISKLAYRQYRRNLKALRSKKGSDSKSYRHIYSSIPLDIPDVRVFDPKDIGKYTFAPESVVFIDEVGMIWDNRDFKNFSTLVRDWFKLQRHYHVEVYLFSQTFDIDIKLRNLTDHMYMVKNYANVFSVAHRVNRKLVVVEPTGDSEGRIADGYELTPLIWQIIGMRIVYITWIPKWSKFFNSFDIPDIGYIPYDISVEKYFKDSQKTS